jgi:hypothetical protein
MFVKRIDESRIHCPDRPYLIMDGRIFTNPSEAQLRLAGYKPLVEKPCPPALERIHTIYYEEDESYVYLCYRGEEEIG